MRKVALKMHLSLDGYVRGPDGDVMEWVFATYDDAMRDAEVEMLWQAGTHVMGRALYAEMASYWPTSTEPFAEPMNHIPKLVFSTTLRDPAWGETRVETGPPKPMLQALRNEGSGEILVHGGASLAQSLAAENLIDEYRLFVHPVALGGGLPLFARPQALRLLHAHTFTCGTMLLTYAPAESDTQ
jgi:dihydrofolate reductase